MSEKKSRLLWLRLLIILVLIPLAVWFFSRFDRKYYLSSLCVLLLTLLAFFLRFESRRPHARELVVLAVLSALAVASRAVFAAIPHFKPMLGIVMLTGVAFGPEAGFLCGAISGFASNFLFGQGPWTPWQMFAYGVAGLLGGAFARWGLLRREPRRRLDGAVMGVAGFLTILLVVGPLLDTSTLLTSVSVITPAAAGAVYLAGLPVNLTHGVAVGLTMGLAGRPLLQLLHRIRLKYGMMEA